MVPRPVYLSLVVIATSAKPMGSVTGMRRESIAEVMAMTSWSHRAIVLAGSCEWPTIVADSITAASRSPLLMRSQQPEAAQPERRFHDAHTYFTQRCPNRIPPEISSGQEAFCLGVNNVRETKTQLCDSKSLVIYLLFLCG